MSDPSNDRKILLAQANARIEWLEWRLRETAGEAVAAHTRIEALEAALRRLIDNVETGSYESTGQCIYEIRDALALEQDK